MLCLSITPVSALVADQRSVRIDLKSSHVAIKLFWSKSIFDIFQSCLLPVCSTRGWCSPQRRLCDGVCLVCSCIIITNPQSRSTSQTSSPKVSERSRAIVDESCVSMVLGAVLAAAYVRQRELLSPCVWPHWTDCFKVSDCCEYTIIQTVYPKIKYTYFSSYLYSACQSGLFWCGLPSVGDIGCGDALSPV